MVINNIIIDDAKIYAYYIRKHTGRTYVIGGKYSSPFRKDATPSFSTKVYEDGVIRWKDWGDTSEYIGNDVVSLVQRIYGYERRWKKEGEDWVDLGREKAKQRIYIDIIERKAELEDIEVPDYEPNTDFVLTTHSLKPYEYAFWKGKIPKDILEKYQVRGVTYCEMNGLPTIKSYPHKPTFAYIFEENSFQLYRPKPKQFKSWNIGRVLFGYNQLPETGELLVITSSMKDVLTLVTFGLTAISPSSEASYFTLMQHLDELKERFKRIVIFFDGDYKGVQYANKLSKITGLPAYFPAFPLSCKDPSDVLWKKSKEDVKRLITNI